MTIIKDNNMNFIVRIKNYLNSINCNWDVKELDLNLLGILAAIFLNHC